MSSPSDPARTFGLGGVYTPPDGSPPVPVSSWEMGITIAYSKYVKDKTVEAVRDMRDLLDPDEYKDQIGKVGRDWVSGEYAFGKKAISDTLQVYDNLAYLFWLQASAKDPAIDYGRCRGLVEKDAKGVLDCLVDVNQDPTKPPASTPPTTGQPAGTL